MANVGGREAGSVTAACFLSRFVEGTSWAHLTWPVAHFTAARKGPAVVQYPCCSITCRTKPKIHGRISKVTRVDFYVLPDMDFDAAMRFACRLV